MLRLALYCVVFTLALSGCVKKASYNNSGKPVIVHRVNTDEAAKTRIALGLQYLKVGEMTNAKFNLEKALAFAPNMPAAHTAMAYYYQRVGENELAEKSYVKALGINPDDPDTLNNYGTFLCRVKRFDEAEKTFLRAIRVPSYLKVAESYENAALCAMENEQYEKAKKYFTASLEHSALRANTLINVAALSYAMGEYRDAQKYGQRLSNIGVTTPRVLLLRALTELKLGNLIQSKKHGTALVSMFVKSPEALIYLSKSFDNSEFEQLRRKYLKHQYQRYHEEQKEDQRALSTEHKIKVKLKPKTTQPQASNKPQMAKPEGIAAPKHGTVVAVSKPPAKQEKPRSNMVSLLAKADNGDDGKTDKPSPQAPTPTADASVAQSQSKPADDVESKQQIPQPKPQRQKEQGFVSLLSLNKAKANNEAAAVETEQQPLAKVPPSVQNSPVQAEQPETTGQQAQQLDVDKLAGRVNPDVAVHVLEEGEFLYDVSVRYNIRMKTLMAWNDIKNANTLKAGRKIYLGNPKVIHTVRDGDTLFKISVKYRVAMEKLLQWNKLALDSRLTLGQKILIVDPERLTL